MAENILNIDLNAIANEEIQKSLSNLQAHIDEAESEIKTHISEKQSLKKELKELSEKMVEMEAPLRITAKWRDDFYAIVTTRNDKGYIDKSVGENKYEYIKKVLKNMFNTKEENNLKETSLAIRLACNYYTNKTVVIDLLELITKPSDFQTYKVDIENFLMPVDYDMDTIMAFVKNPHSCTNGCYFNNSYWNGSRGINSNIPYNYLFANPFMVTDEVFDEVLKTINMSTSYGYYFYSLPRYNDAMTDEQIMKLGRTLIGKKLYAGDNDMEYFLKTYMIKFDDETLDYLFKSASDDNQFRTLYWQNFPNKYQMRYLLERPIGQVMKILSDYTCKWSDDEKSEFIKEYAKL